MVARHSSSARLLLILVVLLAPFHDRTVQADEFWVAPTSQQDVGGLEIASNVVWPVTPIGAVRFAWAIPNNLQAFHTKTVIAGIRGITTGSANAVPVLIDSNGQLGTASSSRRVKEDIQDMADASQRLFQLRPVTFRYTRAYQDDSKPIQFGLIAEEVAEVFPELAVRNADGEIESVHYETLNVLLLNELQKQEALNQRQQERIDALERRLADLLAR